MSNYGQRIIDRLKSYDTKLISPGKDEGKYKIDTKDFRAEVYVIPGKTMGIELVSKSDPKLSYFFDDDLYNMSNPKYADLFKDMEEDILAILDALENNSVLIGTHKDKPAMVIPEHDKYRLVYLPRFFGTGAVSYDTLDELKENGDFTPA